MNEIELKKLIRIFYDKWINTDELWRNEFFPDIRKGYKGFQIKISFGQGLRIEPPKNPWISFLKYNQKTSKGIYPITIYNTTKEKIEVLIGKSSDNEADINQSIIDMILKEQKKEIFNIDEIDDLVIALNYNIKIFEKYINTNMSETKFNSTINNISASNTKNILLYGVPGVGKTYNHKKVISLLEEEYNDNEIFDIISSSDTENYNDIFFTQKLYKEIEDENRVNFITFHQSFGYEDFIEGFRPDENGNIILQSGVFKELCEKAQGDIKNKYFLVIDEINRGNISKIFGELITLIEEDKRDFLHVTLPYSKKEFSIPSNLYIIGTMNSTDKSIALIDIALRRRFTFIHMLPNPELVKYANAKELMIKLNKRLDSEHLIGHSYFMKIKNEKELTFTCKYKIKPLLEEYFYGDENGLSEILEILKPYG